ncbi:uncharacterized protein MONBRDRAFT_31688 [Monosiga brevicollis MX1]|uniref:EF-hand domain-containing protein n=1 Tax=Monosiga brevicollis TaxID=81824 RepID=A9UV70_MONBE|nr:uncharacterized protein MONBRDRAFT_31688 [Monosiga brevicollis MX1]EDQ90843.1 predicted protein [Monosiga brevicollis MX1]|eukprot:XP_001744140.1 hypothetical protein [Monosiga brevicollis MX1]
MGGAYSKISEQDLDLYQKCTFFTRNEIIAVHKLWIELNAKAGNNKAESLSHTAICEWEGLHANPFRKRICQVFSKDMDATEMGFVDFLDMLSVFSEAAPREVKAEYAFRIYDYDNDLFLGQRDLKHVLQKLTAYDQAKTVGAKNNAWTKVDVDDIVRNVIEEADVDGDQRISLIEFQHVISRSPDFVRTFQIRFR